jgi:hypothetical protein
MKRHGRKPAPGRDGLKRSDGVKPMVWLPKSGIRLMPHPRHTPLLTGAHSRSTPPRSTKTGFVHPSSVVDDARRRCDKARGAVEIIESELRDQLSGGWKQRLALAACVLHPFRGGLTRRGEMSEECPGIGPILRRGETDG